jgi:hypothetical protein
MLIIKPDSMPRFWWLFPWSYARTLHNAANALRSLTDRQDEALKLQAHIIVDQSEEIANLRQEVARLAGSRDHWLAKHDRAYAVAMHNERVIADMEARGYVRL